MSGNWPFKILMFMILTRDGAMTLAESFNILAEIPSNPVAFVESNFLMEFISSCS